MDLNIMKFLIFTIFLQCTFADNWCTRVVHRTYNVENDDGTLQPKNITRNERYCCEGYYLNDGDCAPKCVENCPNGKCVAPGECVCNEGYNLDVESQICQPVCSMDCGFGKCSKPEFCECFEGYTYGLSSIVCNQAICKEPCQEFSTCVRPNECECMEGYRSIANNTKCEPICETGCPNGVCIKPNMCACNLGFSMNFTLRSCQENICELPCPEHGYCEVNGRCDCIDGYIISMFTTGPKVLCEERLPHALKLLAIFLACTLVFAIIIMIIVKCMTRKVDYEPQKVEEKYKIKHTAM